MEWVCLSVVLFIVRHQFLGKTNGCERKEGGNDCRDEGADERNQVGCALRVVSYNFGDTIVHLDAFLGPNNAKEYPRPNQHDRDRAK